MLKHQLLNISPGNESVSSISRIRLTNNDGFFVHFSDLVHCNNGEIVQFTKHFELELHNWNPIQWKNQKDSF